MHVEPKVMPVACLWFRELIYRGFMVRVHILSKRFLRPIRQIQVQLSTMEATILVLAWSSGRVCPAGICMRVKSSDR